MIGCDMEAAEVPLGRAGKASRRERRLASGRTRQGLWRDPPYSTGTRLGDTRTPGWEDGHPHMYAESLLCSADTVAMLLTSCTPTENRKFTFKRDTQRLMPSSVVTGPMRYPWRK